MKADKDTKKVIEDGEALKAMAESQGWGIAKRKLFLKVNDLVSILGIKATNANEVMEEVASKQLASKILLDWVQEIEGDVAQYKGHKQTLEQIQDESFIKYYDKEE